MLDHDGGDVDLLAVVEPEAEIVGLVFPGARSRREDDTKALLDGKSIGLGTAGTRPLGFASERAVEDHVEAGPVVLQAHVETLGKPEIVARGAPLVEHGVQRVRRFSVGERRRRGLDAIESDFHGGRRERGSISTEFGPANVPIGESFSLTAVDDPGDAPPPRPMTSHQPLESMRPRLRGVLHHYAFLVSLVSGAALIALAPNRIAGLAAAVYGASLSGLLGVSALFHRVTWSKRARRWMARLDHSMISVLIAGTYTPFGVIGLSGTFAIVLLALVWLGALVNIVLHVVWIDAPKWVSAASYVLLGWVGVVATPDLMVHAGWTATALLVAGGLVYSMGALVYALRRPDPVPTVFGYHEVFHALVVVAAGIHYAAVAFILVPD